VLPAPQAAAQISGGFSMKFAKRMLATLLTLALTLALALPAMAAVNWNEFKITKQPQDPKITHGEILTLRVEVNIPEGVEVEYKWWHFGVHIENSNAPEIHISPDNPRYPRWEGSDDYYQCGITAYEKDNGGNIISSQTLVSNSVIVKTKRSSKGKIASITWEPFALAFSGTIVTLTWSFGLLFPVSPLIFIGFLIYNYFQGFKALFS
jgi:hypothetical protein